MIRVDSSKVQALTDKQRIAELREMLQASDYKVLPDYDKPDESIREQRQAWRDEIRFLEDKS
jgi:hypothetical protein